MMRLEEVRDGQPPFDVETCCSIPSTSKPWREATWLRARRPPHEGRHPLRPLRVVAERPTATVSSCPLGSSSSSRRCPSFVMTLCDSFNQYTAGAKSRPPEAGRGPTEYQIQDIGIFNTSFHYIASMGFGYTDRVLLRRVPVRQDHPDRIAPDGNATRTLPARWSSVSTLGNSLKGSNVLRRKRATPTTIPGSD